MMEPLDYSTTGYESLGTCPMCGAKVADTKAHDKFHEAFDALARLVVMDQAPETYAEVFGAEEG